MMRLEQESNPPYEAFTNSAIVMPKGSVGKTSDTLVGCIVPVVCYDTSLILGHFGPASYEKAQNRLNAVLKRQETFSSVFMYHLNLTNTPYWQDYNEQYEYYLSHMRNIVAQSVRVPEEQIELRPYEWLSEIIVDWQTSDHPMIYTQPIVKSTYGNKDENSSLVTH